MSSFLRVLHSSTKNFYIRTPTLPSHIQSYIISREVVYDEMISAPAIASAGILATRQGSAVNRRYVVAVPTGSRVSRATRRPRTTVGSSETQKGDKAAEHADAAASTKSEPKSYTVMGAPIPGIDAGDWRGRDVSNELASTRPARRRIIDARNCPMRVISSLCKMSYFLNAFVRIYCAPLEMVLWSVCRGCAADSPHSGQAHAYGQPACGEETIWRDGRYVVVGSII